MSITTHGTYARLELDTAEPPGRLADEIARYVLELEDGPARGVLHRVIGRLTATAARRDEGIAEQASNAVDPADFY